MNTNGSYDTTFNTQGWVHQDCGQNVFGGIVAEDGDVVPSWASQKKTRSQTPLTRVVSALKDLELS